MKRQTPMSIVKLATFISLLLATCISCRPSANANYLFDTSSDQIKIEVVEQNKRLTFKAPAGKKITKIISFSTAKERSGKFTAGVDKKFVSLFNDSEKPVYDIELTIDEDTTCRTPTNGVTLKHGESFNVGCVSQSALTAQLKSACKELSTDPLVATFDETKDSCSCLKRTNKSMKYADYLGRAASFKLECKNSGTSDQIKSFCTEIKDRQCPTCIVEALSCQCPRKVTLSYDKFLDNIEEFRNQCENPVTAITPKPIDQNLASDEVRFETECKKIGTYLKIFLACKCTNGLRVGLENWKKNQALLVNTCTEDLELETGSQKPETEPKTPPPL